MSRSEGVVRATETAPDSLTWVDLPEERMLDLDGELVGGCSLGPDDVLLIGRNGGPAFLASELARLEHLANLARTIAG